MEKVLKVLLVLFVVTGNVVVVMAMNAGILEVYIGIGILALSLFFLASMYLDSRKQDDYIEEDIEVDEDTEEDEEIFNYYKQKINEPNEANEPKEQDEDDIDETMIIKKEEVVNEDIKDSDEDYEENLEQEQDEQEIDQSIKEPIQYEKLYETEYVVSDLDNQGRIKEDYDINKIQGNLIVEENDKKHLTKRVRYFKKFVSEDGTISYKPVKEKRSETLVLSVGQKVKETENTEEIELNYQSKKDIKVKNITQELDNIDVKTPFVEDKNRVKSERDYDIDDKIIVDYDNLGTYVYEILNSYNKDYSVVKDVSLNELFTYQISQEDDFENERVSLIIQNDKEEPIIGMQIYNHLHKLKDKIFIATVFNKANLPLIAFHENSKYKVAEIKELLYELLE